ncbi:uncharacterized protein LOC144867184 isoform X2 [Branchiostoma floridae x Branchiostoma japonicum]
MADKSAAATPGSQEVTSAEDVTKQDMTSYVGCGDVMQSSVVSGHQGRIQGQPRGRGQSVIPTGRGSSLLRGEDLEQFSKVSPKIPFARGSGQRGRVKILVGSMRSRTGRLRTPTKKYSSESDDNKGRSEVESLSTPDTRQQKSTATETDKKLNLDGEIEGKMEKTDNVVGSSGATPVRKRRGRPPGKKNKKTLEREEEKRKKRSRVSSDNSDAEMPHEEGSREEGGIEKMTRGEEKISKKRPRLRTGSSGVTPRPTRQCRRRVQEPSPDDDDDESDIQVEKEDTEKVGEEEKDAVMNTWRQEVEEKGQCVCSKCGCHRKNVTSMWRHYNSCKGKTAQQLQCSQCDARFTTTGALKYHLISVHSTSPVQKEPLNERARLRFILKKLGKLQCKNEGCSSSYTTVYGYEYHVRRCGKSENEREVFPCDQCEKTYQSALGLRLHQRTIHAPTPEPDTVAGGMEGPGGESGEGGVTPGKSKRRAAARALLHLQEIVDGEEKVTKSWERQKERSLKPLYSTPELDIMPQQIQTWTRDIKDVGSVDCPYEDCPKTYTSLIGLKAHLTQCDKRPEGVGGMFKCLQCPREFRTQSGVEYHLRREHKDSIGGLNDSGSEDEYAVPDQADSTSDDSLSDGSEDEDDGRLHSAARRTHHKLKRHVRYQPLHQAQDWTDSWRELHDIQEVFPDRRPHKDQFCQLTGAVIHQYIPTTTHSLPVTVQSGKKSKKSQTETIALFESLSTHNNERSTTFFVGGPVWGAEWCPTAGPHAAQYAAISCHRCMDARHEIDKVSGEPGMIQLWCLGDLENCSAKDMPYLSLGMAHKFGTVWDMKWCPTGAWDPPQWNPPAAQNPPAVQNPPVVQNPPAVLPRLGLLAVACSDGGVRVISIPHPEALQPIREKQAVSHHALHHMYLVEPAFQLVLNTSGLHGNQPYSEHGQCFTVAWQPDEGHRRLAAGFYDGTVGMWDLQSQSPLLRVSPPTTAAVPPVILKTYLMFIAHDWVVTSVVWSQNNSRFIATGSLDRHIKFWDTQAPISPIQQSKWSAVRTLAWPLHFPGVFAAVDCSCYSRSNMRSVHFFFANGQDVKNSTLPITPHSATTWSVSYNPWRNCVVSADCAGEVVGTVCPILDPHTDRSFFRFPVYTVNLRPYKVHDPMKTSDPKCVPQTKTTSKQHTVTERKKAASHIQPIRDQGNSVLTNQNPSVLSDLGNFDNKAQNRSLNPEGGQNGCTLQQAKSGASLDVQASCRDGLPHHTSALSLQPQEPSTSRSRDQEGPNPSNMEPVVHQDQAGSQQQGQKTETPVGGHPLVEEDDVPLSGCSDQDYSKTESESDGQTRHVMDTSCNSASVLSHGPSGNISHNASRTESESDGQTRHVMDTSCNAASLQSHGASENTSHNASRTESESDGQTRHVMDTSCNSASVQSHVPSGNTSHNAAPALTNGTAMSDQSQGPICQKSNSQDDSACLEDLAAGAEKQTKETRLQNYSDLVGKYELVFKDTDLSCLEENSSNPEFIRLRKLDTMKDSRPDSTTVEAVHKVAWNPNPGCHIWLLSAGQAGIARVHCIKGLLKTPSKR